VIHWVPSIAGLQNDDRIVPVHNRLIQQ